MEPVTGLKEHFNNFNIWQKYQALWTVRVGVNFVLSFCPQLKRMRISWRNCEWDLCLFLWSLLCLQVFSPKISDSSAHAGHYTLCRMLQSYQGLLWQTWYLSKLLHLQILPNLKIYPKKAHNSWHFRPKIFIFYYFYLRNWNFIPIYNFIFAYHAS